MNQPLLQVQSLSKSFTIKRNWHGAAIQVVRAAENISFDLQQGHTLGLVGETGCGKSTIGRTIAGLYKPSGGTVQFAGQNVHETLAGPNALALRRKIQMIFQDPYASLNPRMTISDILGEPLDIHHLATGTERKEQIEQLLEQVGLNPEQASRFPHEFSGGQRQRIGIARSLAVNPDFIICDEPISALDVSIQAQIVNLLQELQEKKRLTYLFIAHDLAMVKHISTRIAVMYLGSLVEIADCEDLYNNPQHPYTQALLSAIPIPDPVIEATRQKTLLHGEIPSPLAPPSGCKFRTRCRYAMPVCTEQRPELLTNNDNHATACHLIHTP